MDQVPEVQATIKGDVSGQVAIGSYILQVGDVSGGIVNFSPPSDRPPYAMRPSPINLRPRAFPSLLDRDLESESVKAAIQSSNPVSIYGAQGIGKTAFVRRLIHLPDLPGFPTGVIFLDAPRRGLDDLLQSLFDAFYESVPEFKPRDAEIRHALHDLEALVFLDDLDLARDETISLLDAAPNCIFVFSSIERSIWGEGQIIPLQGLPEKEALTLFAREVGRSMNEEEQAAAKKICALLLGNPWHILQASSLIREKSKKMSELLQDLQSDAPKKALLQAALNNLTEPQKRILFILTAAGGSAIPLEHMISLSQDPNARETLQELIALGLVKAHSPRYSLTGDLASELRPFSDLSSWENALADYFLNWLEGQPAQALIEETAEALLHTVRRAGEREDWPKVIRLGRALEPSLILWKRWQTWADILNLILKAARALGDRKVEAWTLHQMGSRALCLGQADQARELLTEALNIRKAIKDKAGLKVTQHNLNVLLRVPAPPKGGKSNGRHWPLHSSTIIITLITSAILIYILVSLIVPPGFLPFPVLPIYLFLPATSMPSYTATPTQIFTPMPSYTPIPKKTLTPTPTRKPTITPTSTVTPSSTPFVPMFTFTTGAFCRTGPGTAYSDTTAIPAGDTVEIVGRNADSTWYYIFWKEFNVRCWISSSTGQTSGDLQGVPIQAAPTLITPSEILQETIVVPVDGSSVLSTTKLDQGVTYRIKASGTFFIAFGGRLADAEYADFSNVPSSVQNNCGGVPSGVDLGIGINDTVNDNNKFPNWGGFNSASVYIIDFVGQGVPITVNYHDCDYHDNSGNLTIEIYQTTR